MISDRKQLRTVMEHDAIAKKNVNFLSDFSLKSDQI